MKWWIASVIAALPLQASAQADKDWLKPPPATAAAHTEIARDRFFEVTASRLSSAEYALRQSVSQPMNAADLQYFGRPGFQCPAPAKAYLIRAAYINGGTGDFVLYWQGKDLVVGHGALGPAGRPLRSALIACLDQPPAGIYASVSTAQ